MGAVNQADVLATLADIEMGLQKLGYKAETGIAIKTALEVLNS